METSLKLAVTSDLHGHLRNIENLKKCEVLIIAGDVCPDGTLGEQKKWLKEVFCPLIKKAPIDFCIMIAGNHDEWFERYGTDDNEIYQTLTVPSDRKIIYLHSESYTYYDESGQEWNIFGTPYVKKDGTWSFMREPEELKRLYQEIPEGLDILISHDTPRLEGYPSVVALDEVYGHGESGNIILTEELKRAKPELVFCGHLHHSVDEIMTVSGITLQNVAKKLYYHELKKEV